MSDTTQSPSSEQRKTVWMRGLFMLIFLFLLEIGGTVLFVVAVVQFFWLLFNSEKHEGLARFGTSLGKWFHQVIDFETCNTDERPFPWAAWPSEDR